MKYRAKKTYPMSGGSGNFITKGKVYDIEKIGDICYFKSEFKDNHSMGIEYLDKYFEKVEEGMKLNFDINKYIGKAIHCDTEEKANKLLEYLDGHGFKWNGNRKIKMTEANNWKHHSENTCYRIYTDKTITYSYTNYFINNGYDIIEFDDLVQDKPRICEIIGKDIGEKFNIKGYKANPCNIDKDGDIINNQYIGVKSTMLTKIINNTDLIEDIPTAPIYTDKQLNAFKALLELFKLRFVTRDGDGDLCGYAEKPEKRCTVWEYKDCIIYLDVLDTDIFDFVKWEDVEPFDLVKCLESIEKQ